MSEIKERVAKIEVKLDSLSDDIVEIKKQLSHYNEVTDEIMKEIYSIKQELVKFRISHKILIFLLGAFSSSLISVIVKILGGL